MYASCQYFYEGRTEGSAKIDAIFGPWFSRIPIPAMSVITPATFDAKKLTVSDIKKLDNGSSQVYINYDGKRLRVQAPRMSVPYDSGDYQDNKKYKVQFSFKGKDSNPKLAAYYTMLEAIDDFIVEVATKNAGKWFKMPGASKEMIKLFYSPSLKFSKDKDGNLKDYPPTQAVTLKMRNGAFDAELYDTKNQSIEGLTPVEILRRGAEVTPISDATGIWVADKKFGLAWKLHQARIDVPGEGSASRGFMGVDEDTGVPLVASAGAGVSAEDEDDLMAAVLPGKPKAVAAAVVVAAEEDDEEEEDDEDEVIPAPPVPAKKAVAAPVAVAAAPVKKVIKKVTKA